MNKTSRRTFVKQMGMVSAATMFPFASEAKREILEEKSAPHRILSANIRVALPEDSEKGFGWESRKDICVKIIRRHHPDIICMQEVLRVQNDDMRDCFPDFMPFGFDGPDMDAYPEGYHGIAKNVILVSRKRYDFISSGNYWLSETPLIAGSLSWNTARARHCNWMRLKDKHTGKVFRILNTHLDHISQDARERQTQIILDESRQYAADFPQILTGDFNSGMTNEVHKKIKTDGWIDSYSSLHGDLETGATTHGFLTNTRKQGGHRIDFIYTKGAVKSLVSEIIKDDINGRFPSDHDFIYTDVLFPEQPEQQHQGS